MTFVVIFASLLFAVGYYTITGSSFHIGSYSGYVLAMMAGLASACVFATLSRNRRCWAGAAVLVGNFTLTHVAWQTADPVIVHAVADITTAAYFILAGQTRWELIIGFLFLASVGIAVGTWLDVIPDSTERPDGFFALSHPDLVALAGHAANVVLGFGAGDSGARVRSLFRVQSRIALARHHAFVALRLRWF